MSGRWWVPRTPVLYATVLLLVVCLIVEPRSLSPASLSSMLPFAAVLAIVSIGQTFVVQQRGIDLSVTATVTLSAVMVSRLPADGVALPIALLLCLAVGAVIGVLIGFVVIVLHVTPLIATLGVNALVGGVALAYSGGQARYVPEELHAFATGRTLGVQNLVWSALVVGLLATFVVAGTRFGRRFEATGANLGAARAAGIRVVPVRWSAYIVSSTLYALGGILIAGFVNAPGLAVGQGYVMPSIAAVVLGGTLFSGGKGHMIGTMIAALMLAQLNQFVLSIGAPTAVQFVVQAGVIAVAAAFQTLRGSAFAQRVQRFFARATGRPDSEEAPPPPGQEQRHAISGDQRSSTA